MSKFVTSLTAPVAETVAKLPEGSFVHETKLSGDKQSIEIVWDNDSLHSGLTYPVPFPVENIGHKLPKGIVPSAEIAKPKEAGVRHIEPPRPKFKHPEPKVPTSAEAKALSLKNTVDTTPKTVSKKKK